MHGISNDMDDIDGGSRITQFRSQTLIFHKFDLWTVVFS